MRRWSKPRRRRGVSLTPLIDVVFLLLIFFVMAGRFTDETRLRLGSADANAAGEPSDSEPPKLMLIKVDSRGQLSLLGQPVEASEIAERRPDEAIVALDLATDLPIGSMVAVIDQLRAVGINDLSFWPGAK